MGLILLGLLVDLIAGKMMAGSGGNGGGSGGNGGGSTEFKVKKVGAPWREAGVRVQYDAYLTTLSLSDGENLRT